MKLFPEQEHGADWLAARKRAYLADGCGTGKTVQLVAAAYLLASIYDVRPLVICPAIARTMWDRHWRAWGGRNDVPVWSYDQLVRHYDDVPPHNLLVLDEAHRATSLTAKRTAAALRLANRAERVWLASATPMRPHVGGLYPMLRAVWPDKLRALKIRSYAGFLERYASAVLPMRVGGRIVGEKILGVKNAPELNALLDEIMLRREHIASLPELMIEEFWLPRTLTAAAVGTDASERRALGADKAAVVGPQLAQELNDDAYEKIVIAAWHHDALDAISAALGGIAHVRIDGNTTPRQREERQDAFENVDGVRAMLVQIEAAGEAISLTAASEIALVEQSWEPDQNWQVIKRIHRTGQGRRCRARLFYADCEMDRAVATSNARKIRERGHIIYGRSGE